MSGTDVSLEKGFLGEAQGSRSRAKVECLHEIFEAQVDQAPDAAAFYCEDRVFSYQEIERRANQFAAMLCSRGVGPGQLIGIYSDRSVEAIVALLGVLKAGAGYVPIDPAFPDERVRHIIDVAGIEILLTSKDLAEMAETLDSVAGICLDDEGMLSGYSQDRVARVDRGVVASDLCYVIFTSGTTGRPKGVMTEHRNAVRFVEAFLSVCALTPADRILQAFSLGFDGSVEEIWMAFGSGAAMVVCPSDVCRVGSEVARMINDYQVTFFSTVPTSLSMIRERLPSLRLLVVSGEPCPEELIDQWATGDRRMLNVYGPTETTVNATVAECRPNRVVTIGRPLLGYEFYLLDPEGRPVPEGGEGELYIGGEGLARGYMAEPELTAKSFVELSLNGNGHLKRLYRTGDLVKWNEAGELLFLGRLDTQVKIRGFRIELAEIEAVLLEHPAIRTAVVNVVEADGVKELAAYATKEPNVADDSVESIRLLLEARLPAYMVPRTLDFLDEIPRLTSGKADRQKLPEPECPLLRRCASCTLPETEIEQNIAEEWKEMFRLAEVSTGDNFFTDLGGYSLLAAQSVSNLRRKFGYDVALRELYELATIKELGKRIQDGMNRRKSDSKAGTRNAARAGSDNAVEGVSQAVRRLWIGLQAVSLYPIFGIGSLPAVLGLLLYLASAEGILSLEQVVSAGVLLLLGYFPGMLLLSIFVKWLVIGRYREGRYPVWGAYYFRWWLVTRFQALSGVGALEGTPMLNWYFRLMGARVGKGCVLDSALCYAFDLVSIGDETCIGNETQLPGYRIEDGMLLIGRVDIGERCFVGIHSYLGLNCTLEDDACLDDLSTLNDGDTIATGSARSGSPAKSEAIGIPEISRAKKMLGLPLLVLGVVQWLGIYCFQLFLLLVSLPSLWLLYSAFQSGSVLQQVMAVVAAGPLGLGCFCLGIPLLKKIVLGTVEAGVYPVESWFYFRKWIVDSLMRMSRRIALPLYTTLYFPAWLRMLGAKVGANAEIATVSQISPDLMELSEGSFFADGSIIGGRHFFRGHVELAKSRVGRRSFIGNSAILPIGAHVGDECLIGCLSVPPPNQTTPAGSEWLGSPAFKIPFRKKVEGFSEDVTFRPGRKLFLQRCLVDALRILLPSWIASMGMIGFVVGLYFFYQWVGWLVMLALFPIWSLTLTALSALLVVVVKRCLIGTFEPIVKPLWSPFVWLNEAVNGCYESIMAPLLNPLLGTPFFAFFLRRMGCKIGKGVFLETTLFSEFDLVEIGDHTSINLGAIIQNHLFEDRIMKASHVRVDDQANIGNMAVVLYDSKMGCGSTLTPLSLLMKGETLSEGTCSGGIPTSGNPCVTE